MANADQSYLGKLYPHGHILTGSLKIGAWSGASGLLVGGAVGIIQSPTPGLFAIVSGLQCALLGTTYSAFRTAIFQAWQVTPSSHPQERVLPSTLAGGFTGGTVAGIIRGRANIIPGIIMFSLFGFAGQHIYNALDARHSSHLSRPPSSAPELDQVNDQPLWKRILNSKYSPMKVLSDEQYEELLKEKLVRVDAEIAVVDEQIQKVREQANGEREPDQREKR